MNSAMPRAKDSHGTLAVFTVAVMVVGISGAPSIAAALVDFGTPTDYPVQDDPGSIDHADLDRDGDIDLVVQNFYTSSVSTLSNNGDGTFASAVHYPVGVWPHCLKAGDLNGDGAEDVVTANFVSNDVTVLLNSGDGTLFRAGDYPVGVPGETATSSIVLGDFDRNGALDAVVTNISFETSSVNTFSVLLNDGDGAFAPAVDYAIGLTGPHYVTAADTDRDGDLDLAITNRDHNSVFIFLNNGDGTFAEPPADTLTDVVTPDAITGADVDLDGDVDLVTVGFYGAVTVLRNNGNGNFAAPENVYIQGAPIGLDLADIDNDGDTDLVVAIFTPWDASDQPLAVLEMTEDGTFEFEGYYGTVGQDSKSVTIADLDGNGSLDLAAASVPSNTVSVLLNETSPSSVGGSVRGMSPRKVTCQNRNTRQRVLIRDGERSWDCEEAGLIVNPGDTIIQTVEGPAD